MVLVNMAGLNTLKALKILLSSFLVFSMVISQAKSSKLPEDTKLEIIDDFSGGLNTQFPKRKVLKNQAINTYNYLIDEKPGSLIKRNGFIVAGSTSTLSKVSKLFTFVKDNGSKEFIVSDSSRVFSTVDFKVFTVIKNTMTTTANIDIAQVRDEVWVTNGIDPVFTWDGTIHQVLDGTPGKPNVPRAKYIEFFQERVCLFNSSASNSAFHFSALTSTDGFAISPDDSRAWPVENQLNIGQGDGQSGTGMIVFNGQLNFHKDRSIYTLFGTDEFSYFARKTKAEIGTISDESIAIGDNLQYFISKDGIYAFDGNDSLRISDLIKPDIDSINSNLTNIIENIWDTKSDFNKGSFSGSTTTSDGLLVVFSTPLINYWDGSSLITDDPITYAHSFSLGSSSSTSYIDVTTQVFAIPSSSYSMRLNQVNIRVGKFGSGTITNFKICFRSKNGGEICKEENAPTTGEINRQVIFGSTFSITSDEILNSSFSYKVMCDTSSFTGFNPEFRIASIGVLGKGEILMSNTTGQFISEISTLTTVTFWGEFFSIRDTNGGNINYFIRAATSSTNVSTETWSSISPGSLINFPTAKNYIQWAATITAQDKTPTIDKVTIRHNEGSASDTRPISLFWKNRYWLNVTTDASSNNSVIYVKSKITNSDPNAFVKFLGINSMSYTKDSEDIFYGGSSTSGVIMRLDFGSNDNGIAIDSLWDTAHLIFSTPYFSKNLIRLVVDGKRSPATTTLTLGVSEDEGDYTDNSIDFSGSGKLVHFLSASEFRGSSIGFRFRNNQLDKTPEIYSLGIFYKDTEVEVNK